MIAAANRLRKKRVLSDGDDEGVHDEQTSHTLLRMINRVHALPGVHRRIDNAIAAAEGAKTALRPIRAKVLATDLDPDAQLARPHLGRRGLQMVLRLLAFNAEAWLAEHFNSYLADPNQYRAILRNLLHLGGHVAYTTNTITITLDRPEGPRIAHALQLLTEELNATPAVRPTDPRPLTYQLAQA